MQPPITSRDNPVAKRLRSLQRASIRTAERAFVVEGVRAVLQALDSGAVPELLLVSTEFEIHEFEEQLGDAPNRLIDPRVLAHVSDTVAPQGIAGIFPFPEPPTPPTEPELTLVVDGVRDPGNLGTLLRSAAGAGASRVLLTPGSVDPYNSKVVRSAMGAHFSVPITAFSPEADAGPDPETTIVLLEAGGVEPYDQIDLTGPLWIVVGSEAHGPSELMRELAKVTISIPLSSGTESLNAGVAGSIVLFETTRQRRISANFRENPA